MKKIEYVKVVLILPVNVVITIPLLIFFFTRNLYAYDLLNLNSPIFYVAIFILLTGLWLAIWSVRTFYTKGGEGTPGPWRPVSNLVITGPYLYVRNPMLLGVFLLLLSESILFSSMPLFFWFAVFLAVNIIYFKIFEEKNLIKRFGVEYEDYRRKVPMLFPKFIPYKN